MMKRMVMAKMNNMFKAVLVLIIALVLLSICNLSVYADENEYEPDSMEHFHTIMRQLLDEYADREAILKYQGDANDGKMYRFTKAQKQELSELAESIVKDCTTDYERIKAVCGFVAENLYYDYPAYNNGSTTYRNAYEAWKNKRTVCEGYARLSEVLLDYVGIPCLYIVGNEPYDISHAFNAAYDSQEQRWIYFDATGCSKNAYLGNDVFKHYGYSWGFFDMSVSKIAGLKYHCMHNVEDYLDIVIDGVQYVSSLSWASMKYSELNVIGVEDTTVKEINIVHDLYGIPVGYVYNSALDKCTNLESISLPDTLNWIDYDEFETCNNLKTVNFAGTMAQWHRLLDPRTAYWDKCLGKAIINCSDGSINQKNTMTVKASNKTVKYKKLKSKAQTFGAIKVNAPIGRVRYKKISGSNKLKVDTKTGKITVAKKTRKGTYKMKVRVIASGENEYMSAAKTVTVPVKVK